MRQQDTTGHINPAQLKLGHISPARQPKVLTVLGESNKTNNGEERKRDGSVDKPQRNRSGKASQVVQHLHIQHQGQLQPVQNSHSISMPGPGQNYLLRTSDTVFFANPNNPNMSGTLIHSRTPPKGNQASMLIIDPRKSSAGKSNMSIPSPKLPVEGEKKSILYMNRLAAMQQSTKAPEANPLMKSSLQELYEEVYSLREKVNTVEQREKAIAEKEVKLQDREKSIVCQLDQQKIIFEEYNSRIRALHQSVENYERRQKDLIMQLGQKEETIGTLQATNNRLKIDFTEAAVKNNILESQLHKAAVHLEEECIAMLAMLGNKETSESTGILKILSLRLKQFVSEKNQLQDKCAALEEYTRRREEQLQRAKDKVTELVSACYSEISKLNGQAGELRLAITRLTSEKDETSRTKQQQITHLDSRLSELTNDREALKSELNQLSNKLQTTQKYTRRLEDRLHLVGNALIDQSCNCPTIRNILSEPLDPTGQGTPATENGKLQQLLSSIFQSFSSN